MPTTTPATGEIIRPPDCFQQAVSACSDETLIAAQQQGRALIVDGRGAIVGLVAWDAPCDFWPVDLEG